MMSKNKVSREFLIRLKLHSQPAYKIAQAAELHPNTLSKIINGMIPLKQDDPRVIRVGEVLGLAAEELFE